MSQTLDLLAKSNHGTPDGYREECKTNQCPAPVACRYVYTRYIGDFAFARRIDAGEPASVIVAEEAAAAEGRSRRDRAWARNEKRQREQEARKKKAPPPKTPRVTVAVKHGARIRELHALGYSDPKIAAELGVKLTTLQYARCTVLGLPANGKRR